MSKSKKTVPALVEPAPRIVTQGLYGDYQLSRIRISPDNRKRFNEDALNELAESIKSIGIAQPILMRPVTPTAEAPEDFEIVAGERRYRASKIAGRDTIPAVVRELSDLDAAKLRILENLQREDPHPMEEAEGYQLLMLQHGYNADQLADEIKKSRAYVYGRLKLCALTTEVREEFLHDKVSASTALLIARIPVPALQIKALNEIQRPYGGMTADPMSHRAAALHIQQRYMLDLANAVFKITDARLLPAAGACGPCPKRAGNQPVVFEGISANVCTDPECFGEKKAAHHDAIAVMALKKGIPIAEGKDRDAIHDKRWDSNSDLVVAEASVTRFHRNAPSTKNAGTPLDYLGADGLPPVATYTKEPDGLRAWYKRIDMQTALEAAGACETVEQHAERMATVIPGEDEKIVEKHPSTLIHEQNCATAEAETSFRVALYKKLRSAAAGKGFSVESLREFTKLAVCEHALPDDLLGDVYDFDTSSDASVCTYVDGAGLPEIQLLLVDLLVGESLSVHHWNAANGSYKDDDFATVEAMAKHEGIDPADVREELFPTPISVDDATAASLASFIAKYPHRLDELAGVVLPHPRGELTGMLERAAKDAGYVYLSTGFQKAPNLAPYTDLAPAATNVCPSLSKTVVDDGDAAAVDGEFLEEMMAEAAPAPKSKKPAKSKAAKEKPVLGPAAAWPFPKSSDGVRATSPDAPADPIPQDTETAPEIPA